MILLSFFLGSVLILSAVSISFAHATTANEEWNIAYTVGKFLHSNPPKADEIFKIQYRVMNGTAETFNVPHEILAKVKSNGNGTLEIRFPRNYPYTNEIGAAEGEAIVFVNNQEISVERIVTDCFYEFSIPFKAESEIGLTWTDSLTGAPFHGDNIPDSCSSQTIVKDVPVKKDNTISPLHQFKAGVAAKDIACDEGLKLIIDPHGRPSCAREHTIKILNEMWKM